LSVPIPFCFDVVSIISIACVLVMILLLYIHSVYKTTSDSVTLEKQKGCLTEVGLVTPVAASLQNNVLKSIG